MEYLQHKLWQSSIQAILTVISVMSLLSGWSSNISAGQAALSLEAKTLDAAFLVSEVLQRSPDVQARLAAWEAAKTRIAQRASLEDPTISYKISPQTIGSNNLDTGQVLSISQPFPWPGKLDIRADIAQLESDSVLQDVELTKLGLTETTRIAFADWYFVHAAIEINKINYSLLQEFQNIAEIKYAAGTVSKQDALNAEVEKLLLQHREIVLDSQRRSIQAVINTLLLRQPDLPLPIPADLPVQTHLPSPANLRGMALKVHPDLISLEASLQASIKRQQLAKQDFYPDFNVNMGYNTLWNDGEKRFTIGAGINIPLRGRRDARHSEMLAETIRFDAELQARSAQVVGLVQQSYEKVRESEHVMSLYSSKLIPLAQENLQAARSDYESGKGNFLDLLVAEKNLMQTRLQLESARSSQFKHLSSLERAVGDSSVSLVSSVGENQP